MTFLNVEIKAYCNNPLKVQTILASNNAEFKGEDHQIDTYFNVPNGRLKLREGKIENSLIHYIRENKEGPKQSEITLFKSPHQSTLKEVLCNALGIKVIIDKIRKIYFIDNVKFHVDTVQQLGSFIEIEAIDYQGNLGTEKLLAQCNYYMKLLCIENSDLLSVSYSDLLLNNLHKA